MNKNKAKVVLDQNSFSNYVPDGDFRTSIISVMDAPMLSSVSEIPIILPADGWIIDSGKYTINNRYI